jgi:hypothetical protein
MVELKPGSTLISQKYYFIPCKAQVGIQKYFDRLLKYGILQLCQSSWNTFLIPVQKPETKDFRPVQDLWAVNLENVIFHSIVPNPYMLLRLVPAEAKFFTCLDLKDTFFCIHLAPQNQPIFAFQWENPRNGEKGQLIWTRVPQGFKNFSTTFGTASKLSQLTSMAAHSSTLLLYVDDLLLARPCAQEGCMEGTSLLSLLWEAGNKVSQKKTQICQNMVKYLVFQLLQGQRRLSPERKQAICSIPYPKNCWQVRVFGSHRFLPNLHS